MDGSGDSAPAVCGNAIVEDGEACDDGINHGSYGGCAADCGSLGPHCGDGALQQDEACDDANQADADGCNVDCIESGSVLWTRLFDDRANGLDIDDQGGVLVVGDAGHAWHQHVAIDGTLGWGATYEYPDSGSTIAVDAAFHPVEAWRVGGHTTSVAAGTNLWWLGYSEVGDASSSTTYDNPSHSTDMLGGLAFDGAGNLYVAGHFDQAGDDDILLRKHDPDGDELWTQTYDGGDDDRARAIAIGADDFVVVVGYTTDPVGGRDIWVRKYAPEGQVQWTDTQTGTDDSPDTADDVAFGPNSEVAVVGTLVDDIWVRKYASDGSVSWTRSYDGPAEVECWYKCGRDLGGGVAVDSTGAVVVVGASLDENNAHGAWMRKYDADGAMLWTEDSTPDGSAFETEAKRVVIASDDSIIAIGVSHYNDSIGGWARRHAP